MFRIGEFSRLANVTIETLRHYDALGLLVPAHIDPFTGYRYYSARQLLPLTRILALKELGFSLEDVSRLLQKNVTSDVLREMLAMRLEAAERDVHQAQMRVARLKARLVGLDLEETMPTHDVILKPVAATMIAAIREVVPRIEDMPERCSHMFDTIAQWLTTNKLPLGPTLTIYYNTGYAQENIDTECGFILPDAAVVRAPKPNNAVVVRVLEGESLMATTIVTDDFFKKVNGLTPAYHTLAHWIEANGYHLIGPPREVFHGSPNDGDLAAEIQMPVAKT